MSWHSNAACAGAERPDRFDAPPRTRPNANDVEIAERLIAEFCDTCPVSAECYADAIATNSTGVRGGQLLTHEHGSITEYNNHRKHGEEACPACLEAAAAYTKDRRDPIPPVDDWALANGFIRAVSA